MSIQQADETPVATAPSRSNSQRFFRWQVIKRLQHHATPMKNIPKSAKTWEDQAARTCEISAGIGTPTLRGSVVDLDNLIGDLCAGGFKPMSNGSRYEIIKHAPMVALTLNYSGVCLGHMAYASRHIFEFGVGFRVCGVTGWRAGAAGRTLRHWMCYSAWLLWWILCLCLTYLHDLGKISWIVFFLVKCG